MTKRKASSKKQYLRVGLRGLTVPGAGVCDVEDLVDKDYVPADFWDMVEAGDHPHLTIHDGPVSADKVCEHRPRGIMALPNAPPPTPAKRQRVGRVIGIGGEIYPVDGTSMPDPEPELDDLIGETDVPEEIE